MSHAKLILPWVLIVGLTGGCAKYYTEQADREVYTIVAQKNIQATGRAPTFTVNPTMDLGEILRKHEAAAVTPVKAQETRDPSAGAPGPALPAGAPAIAVLGPRPEGAGPGQALTVAARNDGAGAAAPGPPPAAGDPSAHAAGAPPAALPDASTQRDPSAHAAGAPALPPPVPEPSADALRLSVADALRLAVRASRDYQTQKETVYLAALALTLERHLFEAIPTATGTATLENLDAGRDKRQRDFDGTANLGISQKLATGMVVVGDLGLTALKLINKEVGDTVDSTLGFTFTQPLWRGAGPLVVQENLTQAERNALYAVRTFARYEQSFAVDMASQYLRVIQDRDTVLNEWQNYRTLVENRERAEWLAKSERQAEFQVDQARQDELRAYSRWIVTRQFYINALDAFKIDLGIPVTTEIALDPRELDRLTAAGLLDIGTTLEEGTSRALAARFDLRNAADGVDDAARKIKVAENGLAGDVDLVASIGYQSLDPAPQSARLTFERGNYSLGIKIDLPIDRLNERNALRQRQIAQQSAERALGLLRDNIILQVRRAVRQLDQARESYEIQKRSVQLAERRVESTQLLLQAGRASQRDVLESQRALVDAQNALTSALVDHTIAGLQFQRDVGTLLVNEEGQIHGWVLTDGR